ncbi:hypothetical protein [Alkaliphilus crotonatoxidans]
MSIKPIDFHLTYANTINESKNKQVDFNRVKDTNQYVQHQQEAEVQRNKERIVQSEESKGKKINQEQAKEQNPKENKGKKKKQAEGRVKKKADPLKGADSKGLKIDIMI